jgi:hypothetical protein
MMEASGTSETSVNFHQTTPRKNPEEQQHRPTDSSKLSFSDVWNQHTLCLKSAFCVGCPKE